MVNIGGISVACLSATGSMVSITESRFVGGRRTKLVGLSFVSAWTEQCQTRFDTLKEKLTTFPIFAYAGSSLPFILEVDTGQRDVKLRRFCQP